ncbi:MAG: hypothetical protein JXB26_14140 [Candidatus Aminicenantes bacterium]|nr:hypothetical protein [Candidatus Aminicenantes bacterium]
MKAKTIATAALIFGLVFLLSSPPQLAASVKKNQEKPASVAKIPQTVKTVFNEGLQTGQTRVDIPFEIQDHYYFPAGQNLHNVYLFTLKNADLVFTPVISLDETTEEAEKKLESKLHVFLQFNNKTGEQVGEVVKEIYIPFTMKVNENDYDPEETGLYSIAYPLPPGDYILSMAIASQDLSKIGAQHFEFSLPNGAAFTDTLKTTPILFVKNIEQLSAPETQMEVHKGFFRYSVLKIEPNMEKIYASGEGLDILFYIFGVRPNETNKFDLDIVYSVKQGDEDVIRYPVQKYDAPIISQQLPLTRTLLIKTTKDGKTEEKREQKNLEPGKYVFSMEIKDNISGNNVTATVEFEVK